MSELQDNSIFIEIDPSPFEILRERYYYLLSSPKLGEFSNAWKYLVNKDANPLAKWLEIGMPSFYEDYPFSVSILSTSDIVKKNEKVLEQDKTQLSTTDTNLLDSFNSFLRIMLSGGYVDNAKYVDLQLLLAESNINHFAIINPLNGLIRDIRGNQDGQLIDSNCLLISDYTIAKIRMPSIISIDNATLSKSSLATAGITSSANEISFTSNGTLFQLEFLDTDGNSYEFPLCDRHINIVDYSYLLHGIKYEAGTGTKTHIYAWYDNGDFTQQDYFHWMAVYGADVNINQSDITEKIWTQKDRDSQRMYTLGVDDLYYLNDLLPIE